MEITKNELVNVLMSVTGTPFVHLVMETPVLMNKGGNPYHNRITKRTTGNFYLGSEYQKRVNKNREKEGLESNFVSEKPSGKYHVSPCLLMDDKTNSVHYLHLEWFNETPPQKVEYILDGNDPIEKTLLESYLRKKYTPTKQGLERTVNVITPKVSNIRVLHLDKMKYEIPMEVEVGVEVEE